MVAKATWIALLRGVNVGGNRSLPMAELRSLLASLGFEEVKTYIQSGNCVFRTARRDGRQMAEEIELAISGARGFAPKVFVLSSVALRRALSANPFVTEDLKAVHVFFLDRPAKAVKLAELRSLAAPTEDFHLTDEAFYLLAPGGIGRSKLAARLEACLGVEITGRNLRTIRQIAAMA